MDAQEGVPKRLIAIPGIHCVGPRWSPDGTRIAFAVARDGDGGSDICVVDNDGNHLRQLTQDRANAEYSWSPDGREIAFISRRNRPQYDVFVMDDQGRNARCLTCQPAFRDYIIGDGAGWSPDGRWIVFVARVLGQESSSLYFIDPKGENPTRVYQSDRTGLATPVWSRDSDKLAFSERTGFDGWIRWKINVMNRDGSGLRQVVAAPAMVVDWVETWSPDGNTLYFCRVLGAGVFSDYMVPSEGGEPSRFATLPDGAGGLDWWDPSFLAVSPVHRALFTWGALKQIVMD